MKEEYDVYFIEDNVTYNPRCPKCNSEFNLTLINYPMRDNKERVKVSEWKCTYCKTIEISINEKTI